MSIMQSVFDTVFPALEQTGDRRITQIDLRIGRLTEVQDVALRFAFEALKPETPARNATLAVTLLEPRSRCKDCGHEFEHDRFTMLCPACGTFDLQLLQGRELEVVSIETDSEPFAPPDPDADPFAQFLVHEDAPGRTPPDVTPDDGGEPVQKAEVTR
ncbi:MAG: hydrogenase maturation nickel metallochaperone HypA [Actinomycetes bacterium]|nr:hydrogenase maturation nickel metallochaperone HypA [Actinomycetes bacterium]